MWVGGTLLYVLTINIDNNSILALFDPNKQSETEVTEITFVFLTLLLKSYIWFNDFNEHE